MHSAMMEYYNVDLAEVIKFRHFCHDEIEVKNGSFFSHKIGGRIKLSFRMRSFVRFCSSQSNLFADIKMHFLKGPCTLRSQILWIAGWRKDNLICVQVLVEWIYSASSAGHCVLTNVTTGMAAWVVGSREP